jgi:hypothetical protein
MCTVLRNSTFQMVHQICVLHTEIEQFPDGILEMYTVHRNRTLSRWYIRNVYCAQKQHFPHDTSEMCTVNRNRTLSRWYIRNVYFAQKQNTFQKVKRNVYFAQKQNTFKTVHQKCVLCTETEHVPDGISEKCTVHRNRTLSRWSIGNVLFAQN